MNMHRHGFAVALFAMALSGCARMSPDMRTADEELIRQLDIERSQAAQSRSLEATVSYYADDAQFLPPHESLAPNKKAIRAAWAPLLAADVAISWEATKVEVATGRDLAYVVGKYRTVTKVDRDTSTTDTGKVLEVWQKQTDGVWKCVADMFNSDLPVTRPASKQ